MAPKRKGRRFMAALYGNYLFRFALLSRLFIGRTLISRLCNALQLRHNGIAVLFTLDVFRPDRLYALEIGTVERGRLRDDVHAASIQEPSGKFMNGLQCYILLNVLVDQYEHLIFHNALFDSLEKVQVALMI